MRKRWMLASTILLSSCAMVRTASFGATLILKPQIQDGAYTSKTIVNSYSQASINHLILKLFTYDGAEHDQSIQKSIPNANLGNTVTFSNLKANTTYRIKAFAYLTADESQLISTTDTNSYTDIPLTNDDHPTVAALKVKLINIAFNGQATGPLQVTDGGYSYASSESLSIPCVVGTFAGGAGSTTAGYLNGSGTAAKLNYCIGVAVDSTGNVYVGDYNNHLIRKITSSGVVSTLAGGAGSITGGYVDGTATAAKFYHPLGLAVDSSGNVYVADQDNNLIRKITGSGVVSTLAGGGGGTISGFADASGTAAMLKHPTGVAVDGAGSVYVADQSNHLIRKITSGGVVTTLAGQNNTAGYADGTGTAAKFNAPSGIAIDGNGNLYVAEYGSNLIRQVTSGGVVTTIAGQNNSAGYADGVGTAAKFNRPFGIAVDVAGNVYVGDQNNHLVRKILSGGVVTTLAGQYNTAGYADGIGTAAKFNVPVGIAVHSSGNIYVGDQNNNLIRVLK